MFDSGFKVRIMNVYIYIYIKLYKKVKKIIYSNYSKNNYLRNSIILE